MRLRLYFLCAFILFSTAGCGSYNRLRFRKVNINEKEQETTFVSEVSAEAKMIYPLAERKSQKDDEGELDLKTQRTGIIMNSHEKATAPILQLKAGFQKSKILKSKKYYPGQYRTKTHGVWKIIVGILLMILGTVVLLGATIGNIGAYGLDVYTLLAAIGGLMLIVGGILLIVSRSW